LSPTTLLVLVNAIHFLGRWQHPFPPDATRPGPFLRGDGGAVDALFMSRSARLDFAAVDGARIARLPYAGSRVSMTVVVPDAPDGLDRVERGLDAAAFDRWAARCAPHDVALTLPRFEIDPPRSLALARTLSAMGMPVAFSESADFTGAAERGPSGESLAFSEAFHKTYVRVDESGTEAAGATALVMVPGAAPRPVPRAELRADRPFLFVIRHDASGLVLFVGRLSEPLRAA
jgi:serpin B